MVHLIQAQMHFKKWLYNEEKCHCLMHASPGLYIYRKAGDKCSLVKIFQLECYILNYTKDTEIAD